jgi:hypothetical protein
MPVSVVRFRSMLTGDEVQAAFEERAERYRRSRVTPGPAR